MTTLEPETNPALFYLAALLIPLMGAWVMSPVMARLARRHGILDHPSEARHHDRATPYLGGVAVAGGLALIAVIPAGTSDELLAIVLGAVLMMVIGLLDDRRGLRPWIKVAAEVVAACGLWVAGIRGSLVGSDPFDLIITIVWVIAIVNALNLIDNMDGLAAGVTAIASLTYFIIAVSQGDYLVSSLALAVTGASLGFLRHNFPPARIFLGDAGSLMLGFLLAALALKLDLVGESGLTRMVIPVLILGVPILDTLLVIIARTREGRPIYLGGTDHSSHRMTELGMSGRSVALTTYAAEFVCCGVALLLVPAGALAAVLALFGVVIAGSVVLVWFLAMPAPNRSDG